MRFSFNRIALIQMEDEGRWPSSNRWGIFAYDDQSASPGSAILLIRGADAEANQAMEHAEHIARKSRTPLQCFSLPARLAELLPENPRAYHGPSVFEALREEQPEVELRLEQAFRLLLSPQSHLAIDLVNSQVPGKSIPVFFDAMAQAIGQGTIKAPSDYDLKSRFAVGMADNHLLRHAIARQDDAAVDYLLKTAPSIADGKGGLRGYPFLLAARHGNASAAQMLANAGANPRIGVSVVIEKMSALDYVRAHEVPKGLRQIIESAAERLALQHQMPDEPETTECVGQGLSAAE